MERRRAAGFTALALCALGLGGTGAAAASAPEEMPPGASSGTIAPSLARSLESLPRDRTVRVLVHLREQAPIERLRAAQKARGASRRDAHEEVVRALRRTSAGQAPLLEALRALRAAGQARTFVPYWIANLVAVRATPAAIAALAGRGDVAWIEPVPRARLIEPVERPARGAAPEEADGARAGASARLVAGTPDGIRAIRAPQVWRELGFTGAGTLVANLDTGVDGNHQALRGRWRGARPGSDPRAAWFDPADSSSLFPADPDGHGTHVLGTMTGRGTLTSDTVGVAWGAEWIASNAILADTTEEGGDPIIAAFQWLADPDGDPATLEDVPDVVQNSWGLGPGEPGYEPCEQRWWSVVDHCEAAGVVVTWSAGNDGPGSASIIVPADRASTRMSHFSIGAVQATDASFPYNVANFSSRGPTLCAETPFLMIKPEVVAPGVNVYSTVPGGGFQDGWSGTSMAGPHAAGIVALLREANPDLDVDAIKIILMDTARDLGDSGEDNSSGWGIVDAYAAVLRATTAFGRIAGTVRNGSAAGAPLPGSNVTLLDSPYRFVADRDGRYRGSAAIGPYWAVAEAEGFAADTAEIRIFAGDVTVVDFAMEDDTPPALAPLAADSATTDTVGPYVLRFFATDASGIRAAELRFRIQGGAWGGAGMRLAGGIAEGGLPGQPPGTRLEYFAEVEDGAGLRRSWPEAGSKQPAKLDVRRAVFTESFETLPAGGWVAGSADDHALSGVWVLADPNGTADQGRALQPEDDHTADPGRFCFVTGNGEPGAPAGDADVDGGCTTLLSPVFDLGREREVHATWWYWLGKGGASADDTLAIDLSTDGGASWRPLDRITRPDTLWRRASYRLNRSTPLTDRMRFRFRPCDLGLPGVLEAALDDFSLESFLEARPIPPPLPEAARLYPTAPNPCRGDCAIAFDLPASAHVRLTLYDILGREVRRLRDVDLPGGQHEVTWDGRDAAGHRVAAGLYYWRLEGSGIQASRPVLLLH